MDTVFFLASKIIWGLLKPESWILIGSVAVFVTIMRGKVRAARLWAGFTVLLVSVIGFLPVGGWLLVPLEARFEPGPALQSVDGILVLGGAENLPRHGQAQVNDGGERFSEAMMLAWRFPEAKVLFTGGSAALDNLAQVPAENAQTAVLFFEGMGLAPERLLLEPASRTTAENAELSLKVAMPAPDETWVLVTSAFHMPRAHRSFERAGWSNLVAWPVDFRAGTGAAGSWQLAYNLVTLNLVAKEYVGLLAYGITGR